MSNSFPAGKGTITRTMVNDTSGDSEKKKIGDANQSLQVGAN